MRLRAGVASDCGLVRPANEDSFIIRPGLYAVCDGMGGARAGEVASQMACLGLLALDPESTDQRDLRRAIVSTNRAIAGRSAAEEHLLGMGTTITVVLIKDGTLTVAHVGDSRAYLMHEGGLQQLTDDHSWVGEMVRRGELTPAQAAVHPHRSVITRALGTEGDVDPDIIEVPLAQGDRVLICSDGLTGMVSDEVIAGLLKQETDAQAAAESLVRAALVEGGEDNVTVVVVDIQLEDDVAGEGADTKTPVVDRILIGPSDRGLSLAAPSHRSRRGGVGVRELLGRKMIPPLRPVGSSRGAAGLAPAKDTAGGVEPEVAAEATADAAVTGEAGGSAEVSAPASTEAPALSEGAPTPVGTASSGERTSVELASSATPAVSAAAKRARRRRRWITWIVVAVVVIVVAIGALAWFNSTVYYVGTNDGNVALFHGLPVTVLGIDLSRVVEQGTIAYESLTPYLRERVDSHDFVGKEEGQSFLRTLSGEQ